jgi:hypothetical protein
MIKRKGTAEPAGTPPPWTLARFVAQLAQILDLDNFDEDTVLAAVKELITELDERIEADTETVNKGDEVDPYERAAELRCHLLALRALQAVNGLSDTQLALIGSSSDPVHAAEREIQVALETR